MMKRGILVSICVLSLTLLYASLFSHSTAKAQLENVCSVSSQSTLCQQNQTTQGRGGTRGLYGPDGLLTRIANLVSLLTGIAAVIMLLLGGFRYIRSSGDSSATSNAQNTIIYAVLGLVVAGSARLLVVFVLNRAPLP